MLLIVIDNETNDAFLGENNEMNDDAHGSAATYVLKSEMTTFC